MSSPELRKVKQARRRRDKAEEDLRSAILAALEGGQTSVQSIADAAGLTRQRVWQIRKGIR